MLSVDTFSTNLKHVLHSKGIKQAQLAKAIDKSEANVSNYVNGKVFPPLDVVAEISGVLGVSIDSLCGISTNEKKPNIENLGDIALIIASLLEWSVVGTQEINVDIYGKTIDCQHNTGVEKVTAKATAIYFKEFPFDRKPFTNKLNDDREELNNFLRDVIKMRTLLQNDTIDESLYTTWLDGKMQKLSKVKISRDNYGFYKDPYTESENPIQD